MIFRVDFLLFIFLIKRNRINRKTFFFTFSNIIIQFYFKAFEIDWFLFIVLRLSRFIFALNSFIRIVLKCIIKE